MVLNGGLSLPPFQRPKSFPALFTQTTTPRGDMENRIKEQQLDLFSDRPRLMSRQQSASVVVLPAYVLSASLGTACTRQN